MWARSSEFVSSSILSLQILTAHAQPFRGARDLAFCLKVPLDSLLVWVSSGGSGKTARMRRLAWTTAARISDKHQIRLTRSMLKLFIKALESQYFLNPGVQLIHILTVVTYWFRICIKPPSPLSVTLRSRSHIDSENLFKVLKSLNPEAMNGSSWYIPDSRYWSKNLDHTEWL